MSVWLTVALMYFLKGLAFMGVICMVHSFWKAIFQKSPHKKLWAIVLTICACAFFIFIYIEINKTSKVVQMQEEILYVEPKVDTINN